MRILINLINEAQASIEPYDIVEDDGDVPHALYVPFDEDGEAYMRFWGTRNGGIALQAIHSSDEIRGRDMVAWLKATYNRPIAVIEAIPEALGFWERMKQNGLVDSIDIAEGRPSKLEKMSAPLPRIF